MSIKLGTIEYLKSRNLVPKNNMVGYWPLDNNANDFSENNTLNNGLVAYWKMDGNSNDSVGSNNGTDTNITYNTTYGKINEGADFNGSSSKIALATSADLKPTGNFTIDGWFSCDGYTGNDLNCIFQSYSQVGAVSGIQVGINPDANNKLRFVVGRNTGATLGTDYQHIFSTANYGDSTYRHFACVYNGANIYMYINAVLVASASYTGGAAYAATSYQRIGCQNQSGTDVNFFNGRLDEISLTHRALSESEIIKKYNSGLARQYPFSWTRNNNHGTVYGAVPVPSQNPAIPASLAYKFTRASSNYINYVGSLGSGTNPISMACWIKLNANNVNQVAMSVGNYTNYQQISFGVRSDAKLFTNLWGGFGEIKSTESLKTGVWYYCVMTASSQILRIYLNGVLVNTSSSVAFNITGSTANFIGSYGSAANNDFFDGSIQELAILNKALSPQEIKSIYNASKWRYSTRNIFGSIAQAISNFFLFFR